MQQKLMKRFYTVFAVLLLARSVAWGQEPASSGNISVDYSDPKTYVIGGVEVTDVVIST